MKRYRFVFRRFLPVLLVLLWAGCSARRQMPVVMRESDFRFPQMVAAEAKTLEEEAIAERIPLPLDDDWIQRINRFLAAGGNNRNISDNTLANPRPAQQYAELLAALKANVYTKSQFESQKPLQKWLRGQPIPGLIDARLRSPATRQSLALTDGHYWWIFYPNADLRLTGLVICQLSVAPKIKRGAN